MPPPPTNDSKKITPFLPTLEFESTEQEAKQIHAPQPRNFFHSPHLDGNEFSPLLVK